MFAEAIVLLFIVPFCIAGGITFVQPVGSVQCGTKMTLRWTFSQDARTQLNRGDKVRLNLYKDARGIFNTLVGFLGEVEFPAESFEWDIPSEISQSWAVALNGGTNVYVRITASRFNNDPWLNWKSFALNGCASAAGNDCRLSSWSAWSACDQTCGNTAERARGRSIEVEAAAGGRACVGDLVEYEKCVGLPACDASSTPVNCQMSEWSEWKACSSFCGVGTQTRTRSVQVPPAFGGAQCDRNTVEKRDCDGSTLNTALCSSERGCNECQCTAELTCDRPLECRADTQLCLSATRAREPSTPGAEFHVCRDADAPLGQCDAPLTCVVNKCLKVAGSECKAGEKSCPCDAQGACADGLQCGTDGTCVLAFVIQPSNPSATPSSGSLAVAVTATIAAVILLTALVVCCAIIARRRAAPQYVADSQVHVDETSNRSRQPTAASMDRSANATYQSNAYQSTAGAGLDEDRATNATYQKNAYQATDEFERSSNATYQKNAYQPTPSSIHSDDYQMMPSSPGLLLDSSSQNVQNANPLVREDPQDSSYKQFDF